MPQGAAGSGRTTKAICQACRSMPQVCGMPDG
jgi:hypothetical protein